MDSNPLAVSRTCVLCCQAQLTRAATKTSIIGAAPVIEGRRPLANAPQIMDSVINVFVAAHV